MLSNNWFVLDVNNEGYLWVSAKGRKSNTTADMFVWVKALNYNRGGVISYDNY